MYRSEPGAQSGRRPLRLPELPRPSPRRFEIDEVTGIGPYPVYPRPTAIEANQVVNLVGGPYACPNYRARARVVFQNKNVMCQYRAVGHPIATAVTEGLVELAAAKIGVDPVEQIGRA